MKALDMNPAFTRALEVMKNGKGAVFITGKAGTGKSTLLSHFCSQSKVRPIVLAPTGVAALNVGGQTIHSFFNFGTGVTLESIQRKKTKPRTPKLYQKIKTIIVDEVSMLRADLLDCMDLFLRLYGPNTGEPFGGVRMIFIGDLYQLPPVVTAAERMIFKDHYPTPYFFSAQALRGAPLEIIELEKVYRQKDADFIDLLNRVRNNSITPEDLAKLNSRLQKGSPQQKTAPKSVQTRAIILTTTNQKADEMNAAELAACQGKAHTAAAAISGDFGKEYYPTATHLTYKVGAQIMLLNNDSGKRWVNGSLAVIDAVKKDEEGRTYLRVTLRDTGDREDLYPHTWEIFRFSLSGETIVSEPVGSFTQFPFRLAWAVTIHKSQGKTFDHVTLDMGRGAFASGQTYVALSRCTAFDGIHLLQPITASSIRTDFRIYQFLTRYQYALSEAAQPKVDKAALIQEAIKRKQSLEITYLKANDTKSKRVIRPLSLGEEDYQGHAYVGLRAYCTLRKEERMFALNKILSVKVAS